jgi:hypothetical protein
MHIALSSQWNQNVREDEGAVYKKKSGEGASSSTLSWLLCAVGYVVMWSVECEVRNAGV